MDARGERLKAVLYAFLAALFYAVNVPVSKLLLQHIGPASMAALLYLGAGIGIGLLSLFRRKNRTAAEHLTKKDLPYVIGMIVLDIAAPVLLMLGISYGSPANASLLGNFEIVATTVIALFVFGEAVSKRLWAAIALIVISSALLSFDGTDSFRFSCGSSAGVRFLRTQHFPVCKGPEHSGRGKDQRLLCSGTVCRCFPLFRASG